MTLEQFCNIHQIKKEELLNSPKKSKLCLLRQVYAFIQFDQGNHPTEIAKDLKCDRSTIYNSLKRIGGFVHIGDEETIKLIKETEERINNVI